MTEPHRASVASPRLGVATHRALRLRAGLALLAVACGGRSERVVTTDESTRPQPGEGCAPTSYAKLLRRSGNAEVRSDGTGGILAWGDAWDPAGEPMYQPLIAGIDAQGELVSPITLPKLALGGVAVGPDQSLVLGARFWDPVTLGETTLVPPELGGVLVAKLRRSGEVIWAKSLGRDGASYRGGVAVDSSGHVLVEGLFGGTLDFGPSKSGAEGVLASAGDCLETFVAKLDPDGTFVWGKRFPHGGLCIPAGNTHLVVPYPGGPLAFAPDGSALVAAWGHGGNDQAGPQINDPFLLKLDADGTLVWQLRYPGFAVDDLAVNDAGEIALSAHAAEFDLALGSLSLPARGPSDWLMAMVSPGGQALRARRYGAPGVFTTVRVANDRLGNVFAYAAMSRQQAAPSSVDLGGFSLGAGLASEGALVALDPHWQVRHVAPFGVTPSLPNAISLFSRSGIAIDPCYNAVFVGEVRGDVDLGDGMGLSAPESSLFVASQPVSY